MQNNQSKTIGRKFTAWAKEQIKERGLTITYDKHNVIETIDTQHERSYRLTLDKDKKIKGIVRIKPTLPSTFTVMEYQDLTFDDYATKECGGVWVNICRKCADGYDLTDGHLFFESTGICSVQGCNNGEGDMAECTAYLDIDKGEYELTEQTYHTATYKGSQFKAVELGDTLPHYRHGDMVEFEYVTGGMDTAEQVHIGHGKIISIDEGLTAEEVDEWGFMIELHDEKNEPTGVMECVNYPHILRWAVVRTTTHA